MRPVRTVGAVHGHSTVRLLLGLTGRVHARTWMALRTPRLLCLVTLVMPCSDIGDWQGRRGSIECTGITTASCGAALGVR